MTPPKPGSKTELALWLVTEAQKRGELEHTHSWLQYRHNGTGLLEWGRSYMVNVANLYAAHPHAKDSMCFVPRSQPKRVLNQFNVDELLTIARDMARKYTAKQIGGACAILIEVDSVDTRSAMLATAPASLTGHLL